MVSLKGIEKERDCLIEIDYYVPFTITIDNKNKYVPKIYWRMGDIRTSLIEICINEESGVLKDITLVSVNKVKLVDNKINDIDNVKNGIPIFNIKSNVENGLIDEKRDFEVYLNKDYIMVAFENSKGSCNYIKFGRTTMGFDNDGILNLIVVNDLKENEYNDLKEGL